jgi:hypothetical protein
VPSTNSGLGRIVSGLKCELISYNDSFEYVLGRYILERYAIEQKIVGIYTSSFILCVNFNDYQSSTVNKIKKRDQQCQF